MSRTVSLSRLRSVMADVFEISPDDVTPNLAAGGIDAWDSVGHLQMIMAVEQEFQIQFPAEDIYKLTDIAKLHHALQTFGRVVQD